MFQRVLKFCVILLCFILFLGAAGVVSGQTFYLANQKSFAWDAVTELTDKDGNVLPIPATDIVKYEIFIAPYTGGTAGVTQSLGITTDTKYTVTLSQEGRFVVGVAALRYLSQSDPEPVSKSEVAWSYVTEAVQADTFGFVLYYPLKFPNQLRAE